MKKICFVLALVLMLSSLGIAPVFAVEDITVVDTANEGCTESSSINYQNKGSSLTGLTETKSAAPLKISNDLAYHIIGTTTGTQSFTSNYGHNVLSVISSKGDNYSNFADRKYNAFSFDVFIGKDDKGFIPVNSAFTAVANWLAICTDDLNNDETTIGGMSGSICYGLEREKWNNVVITMDLESTDPSTATTATINVYINGNKTDVYKIISNKKGAKRSEPWSTSVKAVTTGDNKRHLNSNLALCYAEGYVRDFYIDNVTYKASDTTAIVPGAAATISSADENGIVTVEDGALASSITATGAKSIEVYRKNSKSPTGYDLVESTAALATNDIIKLTTQNGVYSYYTVRKAFSIGNLTAPEAPVQGGKITSSLALAGDTADKNVTLILALYKGITLCDMETAEIKSGDAVSGNLSCTIDVPDVSGNYTAKAFVWSDKDTMIQYK